MRWETVRPYVAAFCATVLVVGLSLVERLEAALSTMHRVGDVSTQVSGLAAPASLWSLESAQELMRSWRDWDADRLAGALTDTVMSAKQAVGWYVLLDTFFVTAPLALLLWLLAGWTREVIRARTMDLERMRQRSPELRRDATVQARALCQVSSTAKLVALAYAALDVLENLIVLTLTRLGDPPAAAVGVLGLVSLLKFVALVAAATPLLLVALATRRRVGQMARGLLRDLMALRGQLAVVLVVVATFVALRGDIGSQVDDVVMRWVEQPGHGAAAVLAALVLTLLLALTGFACFDHYAAPPEPSGTPLSGKLLWALGLGGAALAAGGLALALMAQVTAGYPLVFPGAVLSLFAVLSVRSAVRRVKPPPPVPAPPPELVVTPAVLVWVLAAVPLAALGLVAVRAAVTLAVTREQFQGLGLIGVALILLALVAASLHLGPWPTPRWVSRGIVNGLAVAAVLLGAFVAARPLSVGTRLGTVAILLLLLILVLLLLTALHWAGDAAAPRGALALLRLRRTPLITFVVCWFLVTSLIDRTSHYHDVRLGAPLPPDFQAVALDEALNSWLERQQGGPVVNGKQRVPMVFIATAGGGIRSAYWTGLVLDCLFAARPEQAECGGDPLDKSSVFAASGISGGSLGLVVDRAVGDVGGRFSEVLDRDFLSPDVAALAFRDLPNYLLHLEPDGADRAAVMEAAWEAAFAGSANPLGQGFFATARGADGRPRFPLLMLNSATVEDGCRLNGSTVDASARIDLGPAPPAGTEGCLTLTPFEPGREDAGNPAQAEALAGSKDLLEHTCRPETPPDDPTAPDARQPVRRDIPVSAVAHLSARFPFVSPTGVLTSCTWPQRRTFALDGGLLEASAVSPLTEVWARLAGRVHEVNNDPASTFCVEPRLLMIDNGYAVAASTGDSGRSPELLAPAAGAARFNATKGSRAEQAAALAFDHAFGSVACRDATGAGMAPQPVESRVAHVVPTARPGPRAPLGWSLSRFARRDLSTQMRSPANQCQVALVRSWFRDEVPEGVVRCVTGFAVRAHADAPPEAGPIAMIAPPIEPSEVGVPGVRISASPDAGSTCAGGTTTDATGRFHLLVPAGPPANLIVCWAGVTFTVPVPAGNSPLVTSDNFVVTVPD